MPATPLKIVVVGLGNAGAVHVRALAHFADVAVIAGVDTDPRHNSAFQEAGLPVYPSMFDSTSASGIDPDVVVVATPTRTHADVCRDVGEYFQQAGILVEKPAADSLEDAQRIIQGVGGKQRVTVAYHMAFSPEVSWGLAETASRSGALGPPVAIQSWNADPYHLELDSAQARLGTSWIDSGINALSVIERFAPLTGRTSLRQIGDASRSVYEGTFTCQAGDQQLTATVLTSWYATAPARSTRIRYASGAELIMDHNAVAGHLLEDGRVSGTFGSDGSVPRREAHYRALYQSWLIDRDDIFTTETSLRLHRLLLAD